MRHCALPADFVGLNVMRSLSAALLVGLLVLVGGVCGCHPRYPVAASWLELRKPHVFRLPNGTRVPCGTGIAGVFGNLLWYCRLARDTTIQGRDLPAGATVEFFGDGALESVKYVEMGGHDRHDEFLDVRVITFDQSGRMLRSSVDRFQRMAEPAPR